MSSPSRKCLTQWARNVNSRRINRRKVMFRVGFGRMRRTHWRWLARCIGCAVVVLIPTAAQAQVTSIIQGRAIDPSGAVVPGVSVTVTNEATGVFRTSQSALDGYYRIPDLLAGSYEL